MTVSKETFKELESKTKGKALTENLIKQTLKKIGFIKIPCIAIKNSYIDRKTNIGYVTLAFNNIEHRVKINKNGVVLNG